MESNQKKKFRKIETSEQEFEHRLKAHRHKVARLIVLMIGAAILIVCLLLVYFHFRSYKSYTIKEEIKRDDNPDVEYLDFSNQLLKYSRDGAFLMDVHGKLLWNQTFEMNEPIVDIAEDFMAIASEGGNEIYLASKEETLGKIETSMPIRQVKVASKGFVVVLLEEDENYYINLYDKHGSQLAHGEYHIENSGIPVTMALSQDCKNLAISFLDVSQGIVETKVHIYDFSETGKNQIDNLVGKFTYEGEMGVQMNYFNSGELLVYTDQKAVWITNEDKPREEKRISYPGKVTDVFFDKENGGFISSFEETNEDGIKKSGHRLFLYNETGKLTFQKDVLEEESNAELLENGFVALEHGKKAYIYNKKGLLKFEGTFEKEITKIKSQKTDQEYLVILEDRIIRIKLK